MASHQNSQHNVIIHPQTLYKIIKTFTICSGTNVVLPPHPRAPIEGIKIEDKALECQECPYICLTEATLKTHWFSSHPNKIDQYPRKTRFKQIEAQTLFSSSSGQRQYFKVDSRLIGMASEDTFSLFMQKYVQKESLLPTVAPPSNDRDLPLLVKWRGWYNHLQEFCNDSSKRALLLSMASLPEMGKQKAKALPSGTEKDLSQLPEVVTLYMEEIRKEQSSASRLTLRSLMHYPP